MLVATCQIELSLGGVTSLKEKRRILKSVIARLTNQFNVAIAEVDYQDIWRSTVLGVVAVGNEARFLQSMMENIVQWIEANRPDILIVAYRIEFR